ncbi:DUF4136 domain-containing protein [Verminephrobacter aporrectodeae subsp. tuberculatae]|uniref:DUF4136 domain-containing protein n=1 Tax=Verminephrobacter aporrectodeae TaxID=1110389 RepID=UPI0022431DC8|nr:DUF4136 domain-containing protein [Verminephrobacter aporrectodeae]MCW8163963.1 DUF4136 domain-containing protein [Verminephrobacter aporrectodeae subsp. tuberculatae]
MLRRWISTLLLGLAAAALAGCSSTRLVDGQVESFSTLTALPAPATYRIERLPSQQTPAFEPIAALAERALTRVGLQRDDAAPRLLVQIGVQASSVPRHGPSAPYAFYGPPWAFGGWYGRPPGVFGGWYGPPPWAFGGWGMGAPTPLYRRAVSLVLRDAQTQAVVYETSAVHENVWVSDPAVYGVLFDAALNGFPAPPHGRRQLRLPLPPPAP